MAQGFIPNSNINVWLTWSLTISHISERQIHGNWIVKKTLSLLSMCVSISKVGCLNLQYHQVREWHRSDHLLLRTPISPTSHPLVWPPVAITITLIGDWTNGQFPTKQTLQFQEEEHDEDLHLYLNWRLQLVNQFNVGLVFAAKLKPLYYKTKERWCFTEKITLFIFSPATDQVRTLHTVLTSQIRNFKLILTKDKEAQINSHDWLQEAWKNGLLAARKHKQENWC